MIPFFALASTLLIAQTNGTFTLDGLSLGAPAKAVATAHKGVAAQSKAGPSWSFPRTGGGTVKISADEDGNLALVDVALTAPSGTIDLPAAKAFPIASAHEKYSDVSSYLESDACAAAAPLVCYAYTLEDGSELLLQFAALGNGPLREAIWGDRKLLKELGLISAGVQF